MNELRPPLKPGEWAPDFALPRADQEGTVSVADYRGRSPLLLSFFRGLYCAFCRPAIWRRHLTSNKLRALDVETLGWSPRRWKTHDATSAIARHTRR